MAAESEEIVVDSHGSDIQDLLEELDEGQLETVARSPTGARRPRTLRRSPARRHLRSFAERCPRVERAEEVELAAARDADEMAAAIQAGARRARPGLGHEALGRPRRTAGAAAADGGGADAELATGAVGRQAPGGVEDDDRSVRSAGAAEPFP